jgi:hypothetical protein
MSQHRHDGWWPPVNINIYTADTTEPLLQERWQVLAATTTLSGPVTSCWTAPPHRTLQHKKVLAFTHTLYILHIFQLSIFNFMPLNVLCLGRGPYLSPASLKLWIFQSSKVCHEPCLHYPVPPNTVTVLLSATLYKCSLQTPYKSLACGKFLDIQCI